MAKYVVVSPCAFLAASGGTADFVVSSALAGKDTPENLQVINGKVYRYFAQYELPDGTLLYESGSGVYTVATHTLARTTIIANQDGLTTDVDFPGPPDVAVYPSPPPAIELATPFPSGTKMLFAQTTAPAGWTKDTTHDDKALRVVSGTASSGGSVNFSTLHALTSVGNYTLTTPDIPSHNHTVSRDDGAGGVFNGASDISGAVAVSFNTGNTGGGGAHTHALDMRVKFVDAIIGIKN